MAKNKKINLARYLKSCQYITKPPFDLPFDPLPCFLSPPKAFQIWGHANKIKKISYY